MNDYIDIVFDGPPEAEAGRFVEVEDSKGNSIRLGTWVRDIGPSPFWILRITKSDFQKVLP